MKWRIFLLTLVLSSVFVISIVSGARKRSTPALKQSSKQARKPVSIGQTRKSVLPEQPRCDFPALPDITVEKFQYSGPPGKFKPSQQYGIGVVLKNSGQCQSGVFFLKLQVRVQAPQDGVNQIDTIGTKRPEFHLERQPLVLTIRRATTVGHSITLSQQPTLPVIFRNGMSRIMKKPV